MRCCVVVQLVLGGATDGVDGVYMGVGVGG